MIVNLTISLIGLLFLLVNCILFFSTRKNKNILYTIITIYLTLLFVVEASCNYIGATYPNSNIFLTHYYFGFQFVFLSLFFYFLFSNAFLKLMVVFLAIAETIILGCQYYNDCSLYWNFNIFEIASTSIILIFYAVIFLLLNFKKGSHPYFNFCSGLLFYLSSSCLIFLSGNTDFVLFYQPFLFDIWIFNSLFYIIYQFLIYKEWKYLNKKDSKKIIIDTI